MKSEFNNTFLTTLTVSYKLLLINRSLYKVIFMTFRKCISLSPFHALCNCWRFCAKNAILHFYVTFKLPNQCQKSQFKKKLQPQNLIFLSMYLPRSQYENHTYQ